MSNSSIAIVVALLATIVGIMFFIVSSGARARAAERRRDHTIVIHEKSTELPD